MKNLLSLNVFRLNPIIPILGLIIITACGKDDSAVEPIEILITNTEFSIQENPKAGEEIGIINVTSSAGTPTLTILNQDPDGSVDLIGNKLIVQDPSQFDYELYQKIEITILASLDGIEKEANLIVNISDIEEPFSLFSETPSLRLLEEFGAGAAASSFVAGYKITINFDDVVVESMGLKHASPGEYELQIWDVEAQKKLNAITINHNGNMVFQYVNLEVNELLKVGKQYIIAVLAGNRKLIVAHNYFLINESEESRSTQNGNITIERRNYQSYNADYNTIPEAQKDPENGFGQYNSLYSIVDLKYKPAE